MSKSAKKSDYMNSFDSLYVMNVYLREFGHNTRVVAFFSDKDEYREEIKILKFYATILANRYNLRIGIVTDSNLVKLMKKWRPEFFFNTFESTMVLKDYGGAMYTNNIAENPAGDYLWWITDKSTRPVD